MSLILSRLRLRRDAALSALADVFAPADDDARADRGHRLLWAVFSDGPDRRRDFLWRESDRGEFLALSARAPQDAHHLFEINSKPFEPALAPDDRLRFSLRANAVVSRRAAGRNGKPVVKRDDVVMRRLLGVPRDERAWRRAAVADEAGRDWLVAQGEKSGFCVEACEAAAYRTLAIPRASASPVEFGVLDLEGVVRVRDPQAFAAALPRGFGKAKGFGCGLMLIARAR